MTRRDKLTTLIWTIIILIGYGGRAKAGTLDRLNDAWAKVIEVESSSGEHPDTYKKRIEGDWGIAQIISILVEDVNRILRITTMRGDVTFTHEDALDDKKARFMFNVYCTYYYPNGTIDQWCRLWHRGSSHKQQRDNRGDIYSAKCQGV